MTEDGRTKMESALTRITDLISQGPTVHCVAFSPDGRLALSGDKDGTVALWDLLNLGKGHLLGRHSGRVNSIAFCADGRVALTVGADGALRMWDVPQRILLGEFLVLQPPTPQNIWAVAVAADGRLAVAGGQDQTVRLFDLKSVREIRVFGNWFSRLRHPEATCVALSDDGRLALSGGDKWHGARLWDVQNGKEIRLLNPDTTTYSVGFLPDGRRAFSADVRATVRFWDIHSGIMISEFTPHPNDDGTVVHVALTPDGSTALTYRNGVHLWDVQGGRIIASCITPWEWGARTAQAISADGRRALVGFFKGNLTLFELVKQK
jgi:WD40 repeat protein